MTIRVYKSTDAGAKTLTGQVGKLTDILDDCLVNGYNSKTITITRSGSTATATSTSHGFTNGQRLLVAGANETAYNGEFVISNVAANTFDYTVVGSPTTPATGTITAKVAPSNWGIAYTGTNKRAYRAPSGYGVRHYFRIEDNNDLAGGANYARIVGYGAMTSIDVGTAPFPTSTQISGGGWLLKSNTADATARAWQVIASEKFVYMWFDKSSDSPSSPVIFGFGEFTTFHTYDSTNSLVMANAASGTSGGSQVTYLSGGSTQGCYGLRSITNSSGAIILRKYGWGSETTSAGFGMQYPEPINGDIPLTPIYLWEQFPNATDWIIRGALPGVMIFGQASNNFTHEDTFSGKSGDELDGITYVVWRMYAAAAYAIQTSGDW
jgi:hypothetical protein